MQNRLKGYKGKAKKLLEEHDMGVWDIVQIKTEKTTLEGIILPRSEYSLPDFIEIKYRQVIEYFVRLIYQF